MTHLMPHAPAPTSRIGHRTTTLIVTAVLLATGLLASTVVAPSPAVAAGKKTQANAQQHKAKKNKKKNHKKKRHSRIRIKKLGKVQTYRTSAAKIKVKVRVKHKKFARGKIKVRAGAKHVGTVKLHRGKRRLTLPKSLHPGKHKVKVRFKPKRKKTVRKHKKISHIRVISRRKAIVKTAKKYRGVRYVYGGATPSGFDCSGFTSYVYRKAVGRTLPRTSSSQRSVGHAVSRSKARPGDLIWSPGHVAIYLGGNRQIDAPRPGKTIQVRGIWQSSPHFRTLI